MGQSEFGPGGYLPDRAAKRARKIVLREQMGIGWPIASLVAGLIVLAVGIVYLVTRTGAPAAPFTDIGGLEQVDPRGVARLEVPGAAFDALAVRAGGGVRVFAAPQEDVVYCPESRRLEGAGGSVWGLTGRRHGGPGASLSPLRAELHEGRLYVDPSRRLPAPGAEERSETPACG